MSKANQKITALIVAAGRGLRASQSNGDGLPKQYLQLSGEVGVGGEMVLTRTLRRFAEHPKITNILTVIHPDDLALFTQASDAIDKILPPVNGGDTRQESVLNGLDFLSKKQDENNAVDPPDLVLIHDAARPHLTDALIDRVIEGLATHPAVIPALPVIDTVKQRDGAQLITLPRDQLYRVQTPQGFSFELILAAHKQAAKQSAKQSRAFTDDAAIIEHTAEHLAGNHAIVPHLVAGETGNIKLTHPEDFTAEALMKREEFRTGTGFDAHRLGEGDHVMLGGVRIDHDHALVGHSDADVALHAITDALLGAMGAGDIGDHFPPSDDKHKNRASADFVAFAGELVRRRQGRFINIDLTLICEQPKIGPHREAMINRIAEILDVPATRVSVKATTTEGMGFTGRGDGIAAQASATIALPVEV